MGKTVSCGNDAGAGNSYIANAGVSTQSLNGYWEGLLWVAEDVKKTVIELQDKATFDALVAEGKALYLGKGKFADTSTEAAFFEDNDLEIKVEQTARVLSVDFTLNMCACTSAEFEKLENKSGRLFVQTSTGQLQGVDIDGKGAGIEVSSITVNSTIPVKDTPVEYTIISITFSNYKYYRSNPFRIDLDYLFSEIDEVNEAVVVPTDVVASNGTNLTFDAVITQGCSDVNVTGLVKANLKIIDVDGNEITAYTVSETNDVYSFDVTTALTKVYVSLDGIQVVGDVNYIGNNTTFSV